MDICGEYTALDFQSSCVRESWSAMVPATLVFCLCVCSIPVPEPIHKRLLVITAPFKPYLTLHEAEAIDAMAIEGCIVVDEDVKVSKVIPVWRSILFAFIGTMECLSWVLYGSYCIFTLSRSGWSGARPFLVAFSWIYAVIRPISKPTATPPYDLFALYLTQLAAAILQLGGAFFDHSVLKAPLPSLASLFTMIANLLAVLLVLGVTLSMPLGLPTERIEPKEIGYSVSPEDYTTLWGWITFSWLYPLIRRGKRMTLNEKDIWNLSPAMQSRPLFIKLSSIHRSTLIRRLWAANSSDMILDFTLTLVSITFTYAGPFFLKRILDLISMENPTPERRTRAYIYAFLAFVCALLKAQAEVQHLWYARRAGTRMRSELMALIYDKALKRKDLSGIVDKDSKETPFAMPGNMKQKNKVENNKEATEATSNDPKAGAHIGKIVNLMAGDASKIAGTTATFYLAYSAPFEVIIAGIFLYQLLGLSALAGFAVLLFGWPLNNYVTRRGVRITKGVLAARDKRMGVLNELIGAVKLIKFFAWEERWIGKALEARRFEIEWITKSRMNSVLFHLLWASSPILVSMVSFFAYVMQGNNLDISTAFTAIALFNMVRAPLNTVPVWIVQILETAISLERIAVYIDEEEVTDQVSSLKNDCSLPSRTILEREGLGLEYATFKWNEVVDVPAKQEDHRNTKASSVSPSPTTSSRNSNEAATVVDDSVSERSFTSDSGDRKFLLKDINVKFPEGKLTLVTGPTASGKTALLMAVLGEMTLLSGKIIMSKQPFLVDEYGLMHCISYAAQMPWLRHQSIRDNILFGYPYDEERYNMVVECCALLPDFKMLLDGDATEIGARGVSLSGGQKARVALARAVYARTKYVLLDDPLSAVDSHTSRFLFDRLLRGPLLANRTVVLVSHHVDLVLPGAYYLVRMLDGRIDVQGTVENLRVQGILEILKDDSKEVIESEEVVSKETEETLDDPSKAVARERKPKKLINDEHREIGGVKWVTYNSYLKASSYWTWAIIAILVVVSQSLNISEKLWIKTWGEAYRFDNETQPGFNSFFSFRATEDQAVLQSYIRLKSSEVIALSGKQWPDASEHPLYYIGIYACIGTASALASVLTVTAQYTGALRASRILFRQLLINVVRATFRFHDTTPQGRMLNRFGKDIDTIDMSLAGSLQNVNSSLAGLFTAIITIGVVFPYFFIPAFFLGFIYRTLAIGYLHTGRDVRRMESNSRSPIFSDFGELLEGIVTVRAFSAEKRFLDNLHVRIDATSKMWYTFWMTNRWLLLNFDALGAVMVLMTTLFSISTLASAGLAGLCITSAMTFTMAVYWACRYWTTLELDLNSVERIVEYLKLPQEPPTIVESNRVPAYWPSNSSNNSLIVVENLEIKYAPDLPSVLNDVSFTLKAKDRVGLLGRTGSGKSTLAMSILRFVDPVSGRIMIDGIDITTIGLNDLRSKLTFIPQDATLFSGTLRDNLDPFGEHDDAECLEVLHRVHMISENGDIDNTSRPSSVDIEDGVSDTAPSTTNVEAKMSINLDTKVSAGGNNFSQGQRQLIAMARALLRRSSIIILDEATSSIDFETDTKIQATIREVFTDSLLLTVAHRLRTVIDYDRLIVLDNGKIVEFDTPWNLINKDDSIFRSMCIKSGTFDELASAASAKAKAVSK